MLSKDIITLPLANNWFTFRGHLTTLKKKSLLLVVVQGLELATRLGHKLGRSKKQI